MDMMGKKKSLKRSRNGASDFIIDIIENNDGGVHGKIHHCESGETKQFRSLNEMIILINGKCDQLKFQQPTSPIRSWNTPKISLCLKGGKLL